MLKLFTNLISLFINKQIPAAGFSFGFDRTIDAMEDLELFPSDFQTTKVLITFGKEAQKIADELRDKEINTEIYLEEKDLEKQLKYADKKQIPYAIMIDGEKLILKDMKKRTQEEKTLDEIIKSLSR